ncbi:MAG: class I SAM-dependent RNA methyltransferase, partial [Verrucomicrobiota bacterium]
EALEAARTNCRVLPGGERIELAETRFQALSPMKDGVLISNPPYGIRLEQTDGVKALLKDMGDTLKQQWAGSTAYIYFGVPKLMKSLGLKPSWKKPLTNGGLEGLLGKYEIQEGYYGKKA